MRYASEVASWDFKIKIFNMEKNSEKITALENKIDLCPFLIRCDPSYETMMDYCALNYLACEKYINLHAKSQRKPINSLTKYL